MILTCKLKLICIQLNLIFRFLLSRLVFGKVLTLRHHYSKIKYFLLLTVHFGTINNVILFQFIHFP